MGVSFTIGSVSVSDNGRVFYNSECQCKHGRQQEFSQGGGVKPLEGGPKICEREPPYFLDKL